MLMKEVFHFICIKKSFSIFRVPQIDVFVKELPKFNLRIGPKQSTKIVDHLGLKIHHLVAQ
jgi:hypothetical protein